MTITIDNGKGFKTRLSEVLSKSRTLFGLISQKVISDSQKPFFIPVLFILIFSIGVFARVWDFGKLPPGLQQDEASLGLEAYDLYHFGVDRNGMSFPVQFVSWGNGMDVLYGYMLIPIMALGLTPLTVRLPIMISGILTLPLVFFIAKKSLGTNFGLAAMFLLAISPWHIIMSRWGIDENILPFIFAIGFACILLSTKKNIWFIVSMAIFGLCLYAYGAAYVAVPFFLICAIPILLWTKRVSIGKLVTGIAIFAILAAPIGLYIIVNAWGLDTIRLGIFTIPRLPVQARFLDVAATSNINPFLEIARNIWAMIRLLAFTQSDGSPFNVVDPYGYLYSFSFPLAVLGAIIIIFFRKVKQNSENLLMLSWLGAAMCIGLFQRVNINRIHLVFIPIILCTAAFLVWLGKQRKVFLVILIGIYLLNFLAFNLAYHSKNNLESIKGSYMSGLLPAINYARIEGNQQICITGKTHTPYIFVLFSEKMNPSLYLNSINYGKANEGFVPVRSLGRYTFYLSICPNTPDTVYILTDEQPPDNNIEYKVKDFDLFHVYSPINGKN
jgi:hypothetical protein